MKTVKNQVIISTPEHVRVPFETAGVGTRALAKLVDLLVLASVLFPASVLLSTLSTFFSLRTDFDFPSVVVGIFAVIFAFIPILYFTCTEYWLKGQTFGKKLFKLRVIADNGQDPTFSAVFLRNLVQFIDFLPGFYLLGIATIFVHHMEKRMGDLVAGTLVIQERTGREKEIMFYHTYLSLSSADKQQFSKLSTLSSDLYFVLESFLARREQLRSTVRTALAKKIIEKCWSDIQVFHGKEELFLEKVYLYLREVHYAAEQPQLVSVYFPK